MTDLHLDRRRPAAGLTGVLPFVPVALLFLWAALRAVV
jgi:hypothetical protein